MSPIIREPDGAESLPPIDLDNGSTTPFPEDISGTRSNTLQATEVPASKTTDPVEQLLENGIENAKVELKENCLQVTSKEKCLQEESCAVKAAENNTGAEPSKQRKTSSITQKNGALKRPQTLNLQSKRNGVLTRKQEGEKSVPEVSMSDSQHVSEEVESIAPLGKLSKPGKFKILRSRLATGFPSRVPSQDAAAAKVQNENNSFHSLRRSQSMRIPQKRVAITPGSTLTSTLRSKSGQNTDLLQPYHHQTRNTIKNSKSLIDVRQYPKRIITCPATTAQNGLPLNNGVKKGLNNEQNGRLLPIVSNKIRNSTNSNLNEKGSTMSRNFAFKTIDVICKSVQSKLKGNIEKRVKNNPVNGSNEIVNRISNENSGKKNSGKTVTSNVSSKEWSKINSKRKKIDSSDSDTEIKQTKRVQSDDRVKKKVLLKEKASKEKVLKEKTSREKISKERVHALSSRSKERQADKYKLETLNNKNNDKTTLKLNKKNKGDKHVLNVTKYSNGNVKMNDKSERIISTDINANKNIQEITSLADQTSTIPGLQSHHAIFLSNIHETLSDSCRKKYETLTSKNLNNSNLLKEKEMSSTKPCNENLLQAISLRLSNSLPFIAVETFHSDKDTKLPNQDVETSLSKSLSETHISEKSTTVSLHEVDMKSVSPMSISNSEDERSKADPQSPMSFVHYDPYIDESMDDYWYEGEEETYFGTLFTETRFVWESLGDSFQEYNADSLGSYYLEKDCFINATEVGHLGNVDSSIVKESSDPHSMGISCFGFLNQNDTSISVDECFPPMAISHEKPDAISYDSNQIPETGMVLEIDGSTLTSETPLINVSVNEEPENICIEAEIDSQSSYIEEESFTPEPTSVTSNVASGKDTIHRTQPSSNPLHTKRTLDGPKPQPKIVRDRLAHKPVDTTNKPKRVKKLPANQTGLVDRKELQPPPKTGNARNLTTPREKRSSLRKESAEDGRREDAIRGRTEPGTTKQESRKSTKETVKSFRKSTSSLSEPDKHTLRSNLPNDDEKKRQISRHSKIDNPKTTLTKNLRAATVTRTKPQDPVKVLRPAAPPSQPPAQGVPHGGSEELKRLEAELSERTEEARSAKQEATRTGRGLEALTVLLHHLTNEYDAFSTPKLKCEIERLTTQLTDIRLCLDESSASTRRLQDEAEERCQKHAEDIEKLEEAHSQQISSINLNHQKKMEEVLEKHEQELKEILAKETETHEELIQSHKEELERIESEWRSQMDKQHERHLQALEQLNTCHTQQLKEAERSWDCREKDLEGTNARLIKEQTVLRQQAKKLEETLLSDKDHRLQAAKRVCTALQNEVDSLKTVVEMRNSEVHKLRDQLADKERISEDLDAARERVRSLQAKTEDLLAQMEKKLQLERQLVADHHSLANSLQREESVNKRLSLENEELQWKLRQREAAAAGSLPTSTLDLVTRCSTAIAQEQEGGKCGGGIAPQFTPRSRIGTKSHDKKWSQSFTNIPEDAGKLFRRTELQHHDDLTLESPPLSPRVKAVIEKSNSVSFILDLNDTFPEDPFLGISPQQSPHHASKPRTPILQRKTLRKTFSNLEKSSSTSKIHGNSKVLMTTSLRGPEVNGQRHTNGTQKDMNGDSCCDGQKKEDQDRNHSSTDHSSSSRDHSPSESSDGGDVERISPTGLAWTVPVHSNMKRFSKHIPNRFHQVVPEPPRLLQQPDEDEYEEMENGNEFVEVLTLGDDLSSAPLTTLFAQTPSTSVSLSDSDISQCGSRADLSTEDDDCSEDDDGTLLQKESQSRPQEGAGEAMIFPDGFELKAEKGIEAVKNGCKEIAKSQISSAPSSDSEDVNHQPMNDDTGLNMSWSEDVECDLTSSSEMQELL